MEEAELRTKVKLDEIFDAANSRLVTEYYEEGVAKVKKLINAVNVLRVEVRQAEIALTRKKEQLTKKSAVLDQIKDGNWDLLSKIGKDDPDAGER